MFRRSFFRSRNPSERGQTRTIPAKATTSASSSGAVALVVPLLLAIVAVVVIVWRLATRDSVRTDRFAKLPWGTKRAIRRLEKYELPAEVVERLKRHFPFTKMSEDQIRESVAEFKKYTTLALINRAQKKRTAMTSEIVDEVWHSFILFTKDYHDFSQQILGGYLHHIPNTPSARLGPEAVQNFHDSYRTYFGELAPIWKLRVEEVNRGATDSDGTVAYKLTEGGPPLLSIGSDCSGAGDGACGGDGCGDGCGGCGGCGCGCG